MQKLRCIRTFYLALTALIVWPGMACAGAQSPPKLAILPFEINDTSGEVGTSARHEEMLSSLTRLTGERLGAAGLYRVVPQERVANAVAAVNPGTHLRSCNGCERDIARLAGADKVMVGWIWKVSTLIGTLHVEIKDVASGGTTYVKVFDFRGDNEKAWQRAVEYMVGTMRKAAQPAAPPDAG